MTANKQVKQSRGLVFIEAQDSKGYTPKTEQRCRLRSLFIHRQYLAAPLLVAILDVDLAMRVSKVITTASVIVFVAALTQKGFHTAGERPGDWSPGLYLLLIGLLGVLYGIYEWLGNPVLLTAWIFSLAGKDKIALPLGVLATVLIAAFLFRQTIVASEAPTYSKISGYAAGYWLWLTSAMIAAIGALVGTVAKTK